MSWWRSSRKPVQHRGNKRILDKAEMPSGLLYLPTEPWQVSPQLKDFVEFMYEEDILEYVVVPI